MTNIYQEIHNEHAQQVEQLEADYKRYLKTYTEIKGNKILRYISRTGLRGLAITCYVLFILTTISMITSYTTWFELIKKTSEHITNNTPFIKEVLITLICLINVFWPAIAFLFCGLFLARIRRRNKIIHSLSDLLEEIISRTGASIQKAKETQKDFERFASEIVKKQMQNNSTNT